ncbi:MAG: hypothetical protein KBE04_05915 [Phycisphaerae bacterium]|nr:hypothetical protein [Phycisphaerae bacterium]
MGYRRWILSCCMLMVWSGWVLAADVILNEYNAVDGDEYLNGGEAAADLDGLQASDSYFGRVLGNGGDWFELVVIKDHLDMRRWSLEISTEGAQAESLLLTGHDIWSDLRSGTIITVSENVPSDISYDPCAGDWWINVQASNTANGLYIKAANFPVDSKEWQLTIKNNAGAVVFGPAGEGISPESGIGNTEVFKLEANPDATITPTSADYDDGDNLSTFGSPNRWGMQDLAGLRSVVAESGSLSLLYPVGEEKLTAGTVATVTWQGQDTQSVRVDFSVDNGAKWVEVFPPNVGNTGEYAWLVPLVDSTKCLLRIASRSNPAISDMTPVPFAIQQ